ncbi:MAG: hypothetical protein HKN62_16890 [Phycisphaerales bacterium]|nr:hypothetical protein [Phycisphaerales bacterium]
MNGTRTITARNMHWIVLAALVGSSIACASASMVAYKTGLATPPPHLVCHRHGDHAPRDHFGHGNVAAVTAYGFGGQTVTLELYDLNTGLTTSFPDPVTGRATTRHTAHIAKHKVAEYVLTGLKPGRYSARLFTADTLQASCDFSVSAKPEVPTRLDGGDE